MAPTLIKAEDHGPPAQDYTGSLWDLLRKSAEQHYQNTALTCCKQAADHLSLLVPQDSQSTRSTSHLEWTYAQLLKASETLGLALRRYGLEPGSTLVVFCPNNAEWTLLLWACASIGVTFAPLNPGFIDRLKEMRHVLETLQPAGIAILDQGEALKLGEKYPDLLDIQLKFVLSTEPSTAPNGWVTLSDIVNNTSTQNNIATSDTSHDNPELILFTSGTTSMPKACPHTGTSLEAQSRPYWETRRIGPSSRVLPIGPGFHILTVTTVLLSWRGGASVVFAAPKYETRSVVHALNTQNLTNIACSPSIMMALLSDPDFSRDGYPSLRVVVMGADRVTKELVKQCKGDFRPEKVANGWGMTEGLTVVGANFDELDAWREGEMSVGHVLPGAAIRVCAPDTTEAVNRGETGELHMSGPQVISGYYSKRSVVQNDSFYELDGRTWFKTGDAVVMDDEGNVFLTGRFKDSIIRGGENVHPGLIENCLNALPGVQSQVVGIDDPFTGQAIAAILKLKDASQDTTMIKQSAQSSVLAELGSAFRLTAIYTLSELGLESFPMTATNKVRKADLQDRVREKLQLEQEKFDSSNQSTLAIILELWQQVLGAGPSDIISTTTVSQMADSLVLMRFCYLIERRLNKRLTPADVLENDTPRLQSALLEGRSANTKTNTTLDQSIYTASIINQPWITDPIRSKLSTHLTKMGYDWNEDVEAVYQGIPAIEMFDAPKARPASHNFRWVWRAKEETSPEHISACLKKCLEAHAALRAVVIPLQDDTVFPFAPHVVIKSSDRWLDAMVRCVQPVESDKALYALTRDPNQPFAESRGPCFLSQIIPVSGSQRPGVFIAVNHAVFDATSLSLFFDDLEDLLSGARETPQSWIPYSVFAEMYRLHRDGAAGQISKDYQLAKFLQLDNIESCLWPPAKGPGFMIGHDEGWKHWDGTPGAQDQRVSREPALSPEERGEPVHLTFEVPSLQTLRSTHAIEPFTLVKAAIALFNISETKQSRAVFSSTEAGRKWPFMEPWVASHLPNPMSVAGPTLGWAFDFIPVDHSDTAGELLQRIAASQKLDSAHCHAPWNSIISDLGPERGNLVHDIAARQVVTWDPSTQRRAQAKLQQEKRFLELQRRVFFGDFGLFWNFGLESPTRIAAFAMYDDVHLVRGEVEVFLDRIRGFVEWLADGVNWGRAVGDVL